jgi:hypothetical protein
LSAVIPAFPTGWAACEKEEMTVNYRFGMEGNRNTYDAVGIIPER